jgi:hypothetical protein
MGKTFDHPVTCSSCGQKTEGKIERFFLRDPAEVFDKGQVIALATAIHRGDSAAAAVELDILFRDEPEIVEWIAQGRASGRP